MSARELDPDQAVVDEGAGEPDADAGEWHRLHPKTIGATALAMVGVALLAGVPTAIGIASGTSLGVALAWVLPGAVVLIAGGVGLDQLRVRHTRYRETPGRLEMRKGILFTTRRSLARERIRSVDLSANPLVRVFGLVTVKVGTGEGMTTSSTATQTIVLDSVSRAEGERLRAELLDRVVRTSDDTTDDTRLGTWDRAWTKYAPLSFWTLALAGIALGGLFQVSGWFGLDGLPVDLARELAERIGVWPAILVGTAGFVLAGIIANTALFVEAWWNFRLDREPGGTLRVRRGLLTTRSLSLEEKRIRGVDLVEPLGIRLAGAARVDVVATGVKSDPTADLTTLLPPAPRAVADGVAGAVQPIDPHIALPAHPRTARARRLRWAVSGVVAALVVLTVLRVLWTPHVVLATIIAIVAVAGCVAAVLVALDAYRSLGHALGDEHLVARSGSVRRSTVFLQREGIVGWRIRQSVFQRRAGLATVTATTAAGAGHYSVIDGDEHEVLDFADAAVPGLLRPFLVNVNVNDATAADDDERPDGSGPDTR